MAHRLKSLEMQGYKTFASRHEFAFAGAITAIVGPNGSGKSNVVDALRWVLGEQSFSLLRGKKTEDMIFAGSEQRPRAGMASATIVFDNGDGWLPIDFSEVAITRRAYRDGQNEYLINGQRVRLKDVSELLAQSGLAERTYTIIGQGLVDAALSLRAEERRRLFEEAAGIGLHRSRKEESLRRLDTTKRNLERVEDILAELQPRLRSLERQARRTIEYEQIKADLQLVLREWYGYHWHRTQKELVSAQEVANLQEKSLEGARQRQQAEAEKMSAVREQLSALRARLNAWHRQLASVHDQRERLGRELAVADERSRSLVEQGRAAEAELTRMQSELALAEERLQANANELAGLRKEVDEARAQAQAARTELQTRQQQRSAVERVLNETRRQIADLHAGRNQAQARLSERKLTLSRQEQELNALLKTLEQGQAEVQAAQAGVVKAEQALAQARLDLQAAEQTWQEHQTKQAQIESERRQAQDRLSALQTESVRLKARLEVLEQADQALAGYAEGARLLLQAARQKRLSGASAALSSRLEVPARLESAIGAALGEYLDAVLLDSGDGPEQALELLSGQPARAALLPLNELKPLTPSPAPQIEGCLGNAADLVQANPELRPAIDLLLGQVWVAEDRRAARRLIRQANQPVRVVTLKGEVFHASGLVQAGGAGGSGSTLSRPRQRKEIQADLESVEKEAGAAKAVLEAIQRQAAELNALSSERRAAIQLGGQKERSAAGERDKAQLALASAQRQAQWQANQRTRLESDLKAGQAAIQQMQAEIKSAEEKLSAAQEKQRSQTQEWNGLSLEEQQTSLAHWNTQLAVAERVQIEATQRWQEAGSGLERLKRAQVELQKRQAILDSERLEIESNKERLRLQESELTEQAQALQTLVSPAEDELDALERQQEQAQKAEEIARQALSAAEHRHAQARISLNRSQEALDSLRRRIEDDFGLVAFDYIEEVSGPTPLPLDGMVEHLPVVAELSPELEDTLSRKRAQLRRMGPVNPEAQKEYKEVKERFEFLTAQIADLNKAEEDIRQVIAELDELMQREFRKTFDAVAAEFRKIFTRLFGGGSARLILTDPSDLTTSGIDIEARLPGRRAQGLSLLSGGERSLTAAALVFSLLRTSPTPFCILDEVDAMLDEANVSRFRDLLRELSDQTQFLIITHNRNTVQAADVIYGVTMGRDSTSQVVSLRFDELPVVND